MDIFVQMIAVLKLLVIGFGAGLGLWGGINHLEGYGQDNPASKSQGVKHFIPRRSRNASGLGERPLTI